MVPKHDTPTMEEKMFSFITNGGKHIHNKVHGYNFST